MNDVVVIGSGFAGTLTAWALHRAGARVRLVDRSRHPRFSLGEATTPSASLILESFTSRWGLEAARPLARYGTWKEHYPDLPVGLKRGFTFLDQSAGRPSAGSERDRLVVAASPTESLSDTNWLRSEFDAFLLDRAREQDLPVSEETTVEIREVEDRFVRLVLRGESGTEALRTRFLVDASGRNGFGVSTGLVYREPGPAWGFDRRTRAVFGHFENVARLDTLEATHGWSPGPHGDDDAAVHHLFDGGWAWVLRFDSGVTSVGAVLDEGVPDGLGSSPEKDWATVLERTPLLAEQLAEAAILRPLDTMGPVSWKTTTSTGNRFALLPGAAGFVDPMFSTGIALSLAGVNRLAGLLEHCLGGNESNLASELGRYGALLESEMNHVGRLANLAWEAKEHFPDFVATTKLYFAGASMWESRTRLGLADHWSGLYLADDEHFGHAFDEVEAAVRSNLSPPSGKTAEDVEEITAAAIAPFDVAGLNRHDRNGLFPVDPSDLLAGASLLGLSEEQLRRRLHLFGLQADDGAES